MGSSCCSVGGSLGIRVSVPYRGVFAAGSSLLAVFEPSVAVPKEPQCVFDDDRGGAFVQDNGGPIRARPKMAAGTRKAKSTRLMITFCRMIRLVLRMSPTRKGMVCRSSPITAMSSVSRATSDAGAHCDADGRGCQHRRVVHSVADHGCGLRCVEFADRGDFVLGQQATASFVESDGGGNRRRNPRTVAGEHDHAFDTDVTQTRDNLWGFGPRLIHDTEYAEEPAVVAHDQSSSDRAARATQWRR